MRRLDTTSARTRRLARQLRQPTGAALIAVLLLTMVLSGIGVVAVQNTFNSLQLAGNYRLRRQAQETANAAVIFAGTRAGDRPVDYVNRIRTGDEDGIYRFSEADVGDQFYSGTTGGETGLFTDPSDTNTRSHESDANIGDTSFDVVFRDPTEGPPPPGSDAEFFCSTKIYLAARSRLNIADTADSINSGDTQDGFRWDRPSRSGSAMVAQTAYMMPLPCQ